ncbi:cytochrome P450 4c3-like [Panonychus citri]|uniref:cytochrome P450 4c3-like n=1 Tax=Panonychus citri TaxID=50023 RepID=UPI00230717A0|nr:cytochrome P450 4c3-like [Panonychus citri]
MDLLSLVSSFKFTPLSIFWSIVTTYLVFNLINYSIYLYRLSQLPTYRPICKVYEVFISIARGDSNVLRIILEEHEDYFQKNGYCVIWFLCIPCIMVGRYDKAQETVGTPATLDKGHPFKTAEIFFGQGIISSKDEKWKSRRRLVRQQFSPLSIPHYTSNIRSLSESVNKSIQQSIVDEKKTGKPLDIRGFFSITTMKMILGKASGVEFVEKDYRFLIKAMDKFLHQAEIRMMFPLFYTDFLYEIYIKWTGTRRMIDKTNKILVSAIRKKYNQIKGDLQVQSKSDAVDYDNPRLINNNNTNNNSSDLIDSSEESKRSNSLSEFLMRTWVKPETGLTEEIESAILEEIKAVLVAGSDGPDSLMTWFIYIIGCYPEYQEMIYQEVKDIDVKDWTLADVNSFQFLDQCFKEATRLYTSVPVKIRKAERDQIMNDGKVIPKGSLILVSLISILRDSKIFPQPFQYKPQRFAPDATPKIPNGAYIPFGIRPRDCIGQRLAPFYIKFIVGSIIKSFKIKSHRYWDDISYKFNFVFKPTDPLHVTFTPR